MPAFAFTEAQAAAIRAPLSRFAAGAVADFIGWAEYTVPAWQEAWPRVDLSQGKADLERLKKLGKAVNELHEQLNEIDPAWLRPVLDNMQWPPDDDFVQKRWRLQRLIGSLHNGIQVEIHDYSMDYGFNGRGNARKVDLVERLAWDYHHALNEAPTTSPGSPFMDAARAIGEALGEVIGKGIVADAVRRWRNAHKVYANPADL